MSELREVMVVTGAVGLAAAWYVRLTRWLSPTDDLAGIDHDDDDAQTDATVIDAFRTALEILQLGNKGDNSARRTLNRRYDMSRRACPGRHRNRLLELGVEGIWRGW